MAENKKYLDRAGLKALIHGLKAKNDILYAKSGHVHTPDQLAYTNDKMTSADTVKDALDILVANVIRNAAEMSATTTNMEAVQDEIDALKSQVGKDNVGSALSTLKSNYDNFVADQATKDQGQDSKITALEGLVGKKAEGEQAATGLHKAIADEIVRAQDAEVQLEAAIESNDADILALQNALKDTGATGSRIKALEDANKTDGAIGSKIAAVEQRATNLESDLTKQKDATQDGTLAKGIAEAKADVGNVASDLTTEISRAQDAERGLQDAINNMKNADVEGSLAAKIKALEEANDTDGAVAQAIKEVKDAADTAQKDVDDLEKLVGNKDDDASKQTVFGAIAAEATRAVGVEATNAAAAKAAQDAVDDLEALVGDKDDTKDDNTVFGAIKSEEDRAKTAEADAKKAGTDAQAAVEALEGLVGNISSTKESDTLFGRMLQAEANINAMEADCLKAADKTELSNAIKAEKDRMDAFMSAAAVGDRAVDTLKEIQDYITGDGQAASTMTNNIAANKDAIDILNGADTVEGSVAKAVKDAKTELTTAIGAVATDAEADATAKANAAKDYALGLIGADDAAGLRKRIKDIEGVNTTQTTNITGLRTDLGNKTDAAAADGSAFARIAQNTADIAQNAADIAANKKDVDENLKDLSGRISSLSDVVGGIAEGEDGEEVFGLVKDVADNAAAIAAIGALTDTDINQVIDEVFNPPAQA